MSKFEDNDLPRLHIMQQLTRAKLSIYGGTDVGFRDGSFGFVNGRDAEQFLDVYSTMKPSEKEEFQRLISESHDAFVKELQELNKYNNKQTEILTNGTVGKYGRRC